MTVKLGVRVSMLVAVFVLLTVALVQSAFAQQPAPVFTPGNLIVSVGGCGVYEGTCTDVPYSGNASFINGPAGGYSDDQGSPWTLFQFSVTGATSATYVNSVQLPQLQSGANLPVSNDYGSLSEGTLQLSGDGRFLTIMGYGLNAATFNSNYLLYCPGSTTLSNACVPENGNPAMAQTGSVLGQTYSGNTPVPRVAALIDPYGNVNSSTALYNIYNENDARSAYTANGSTIYVSGQGCKTYSADGLCDGNSTSPYDDTMGVYLSPVGVTNDTPTPITGPDNGPTGCTSLSTCTSSQDTRMVQIYNGTVYVSTDSKPGSSTGGYNRSYVGTLGAAGATSVYTCGGLCPTGDGPYGPAIMPGLGNTGGTGKYTLNTAGGQNNSNGNSLSVGLAVNLAPQNFFFASPSVLYVADTGFPKNTSNGPDAVCTADGGKSSATVGDGGLQKWILNPTVTAGLANGSPTVSSATSGAFTQGEVGLPITGTGIPAGTTITAVSSAGKTATMSANATVTNSTASVTISGWSLAYTLYNGLNLVLNGDCNPNTPIGPGGNASTGLYGVTGVVSGGVATLYVTSYPNNDLVNSYLYGITDTLATTTMVSPGTAFTQLATAPSDSVFRGVSMAPSLPNGSETITSTPSGLTFTTSGSGCAPGTYITPFTLTWTSGSSCTLSVAATQTVGNTPTNPATTTYNFVKWQDGTSNPASDVVAAQSTPAVYNIAFQTVPTVVFPTASALTYGQALSSSTLSGGSASVGINGTTVPGGFAFTSPATIPTSGTSSQSVTFTPADTTDYASVTGSVSVTVSQDATTITTPPTATTLTYGQSLGSSTLMNGIAQSGSTTVAGSFTFTNPTVVPNAGTSAQAITFTPSDPTDYSSATGTVNVTVNQATTTISTPPTAGALTYGQALSAATLTNGAAVSGSTSVPGMFAFTNPSTVPPTGTSAQPITFTPADTIDYTTAMGTVNVTVNPGAATITISNTTQTYSGSPESVTVTTMPSGLGISVSYTGTNGTTYATSTTAPSNPGTYSVLVMVTDPNYAGQQSGTLTINQVDPTVSLALMAGMPATTPYGTTVYFDLSTATTPQCPTGTAQLYVDGAATGSPVTLSGTACSQPIQFQISTLTTGQHSIYVAYSGDTYFEPENTSTLSYTVTQDATTVTLGTSGTSVNVGQPLTFTATVTPASPNNGQAPTGTVTFFDGSTQIGTGSTLTATPPYTSVFTTSSLSAGSHNISASFTDTDGNFTGNSSGVDVETVNLIVPTINWTPSPTEFPYGTALGSGQLNATAVDSNNNPVSGSFAYNFASGTILQAGTVNLTATFTPADPTTYATNMASVTITVDQATPTVSVWPTASAIKLGQSLASSTLTGGMASVQGNFAFTNPSTIPSAAGTVSESVTFTPADQTDYTSVTGTVSVTVSQVPAITSAASATFTVGTAGTFTMTATGSPAPTFSETGALPNGVTLSSAGVLSGTPAAGTGGVYSISVTASNAGGTSAAQTFTLTVDQAPAITSAASTTFATGTAGSFTVTATSYPAPTFTKSGTLPGGVTFNTTTGVLSGTPTKAGAYTLTFTATNSVGTSAAQTFTLTVGQTPAITSAAKTTFTVGTAGAFTMTASGSPVITFSETGALPSGVTLSSAGVLSGTPAAGTGGVYTISVTASNAIGTSTAQTFTLTVDQAAVITSAASTSFTTGTAGSFTVTATGYPAPTFTRSGTLPSGVSFNTTTGVLSGTPAASAGGSYSLTFTANNSVGTSAAQSFTLTVGQAPAITSAAKTTFTVGTAGAFTMTATGSPAPAFSETGALPSGVTLSSAGVLSGTPAAGTGGVYSISVTASNSVGTSAAQTFTLTVDQAPAITSAASTSFTTGAAGSFTVKATGYPAPTFTRSGTLPSGVTFNTTTGVLGGTPGASAGGSYTLTFTAVNSVGTSAAQTFTLTVGQAPAITSAAKTTFTVGTAGAFTMTATGSPAPAFSETGALPSGVTLSSAGVLSGTPAASTGGVYTISVTATNSVGTRATQTFTLTVDQAPAITSAAGTTFTTGTAGSFTVRATGYPAPTFTRSGTLPSGVTFNTTTGVLSGTPSKTGTYTLTFTAANSVGTSAAQTFTLTVN